MKTEIKKTLANYGLGENEINVYLAVLKLGDATIRELALETKIRRTTIYLIVEKLIEKGIIGQYKVKHGTRFVPSNLKTLTSRLDDLREEVDEIIPKLRSIEKKKLEEPSIKYYKGSDGFRSILNDSLDGYSHTVLYIGSAKDINDVVSEKFVTNRYIPTRLKKNIRFKQLVFADDFSRELEKNDSTELRETRLLPGRFKFESNMIIYGGKVAYFSSKNELVSMLIESEDISSMEKQKFEMLWESSRSQ